MQTEQIVALLVATPVQSDWGARKEHPKLALAF